MFSYIRNTNSNLTKETKTSITQIFSKSFAFGKWNLHRFRKETTTYQLRDFTKNQTAQKWMNEQIQKEKSKIKTQKLSHLLQTEDRNKLKTLNPIFSPSKRQFNRLVRKKAIQKININEEKDFEDLSLKLFQQDHTAAILENIRKIQENNIFNRKMHEVREKKLSMKLESRKRENLIENFDQNFSQNKFDHNKSYNLFNFYPEGKRMIGNKINEQNKFNTRLNLIQNENFKVNNKFVEYENNKKVLSNMRIESMLSNQGKKHNEKLLKYLENDYGNKPNLIENYNNNSFNSLSETLNKNSLEIVKENKNLSENLSNYFQPHLDLTSKIQQFELEVYSEYKKLDLYNKYQMGITKFSDLSLDENLNYIKFNIPNSKDLFKMYKEITIGDFTKKEDKNLIISGILQKLSIGYKKEEDIINLFNIIEYKDLLRTIKNNLDVIDDKNIVDNLWSISKLHKRNRNFSPEFFQHFLNEIITEISDHRINYLNLEQISFLCEGLDYLKINQKYDEDVLIQKEEILVNKIFERILQICNNNSQYDYHLYNLSKILNYFYNINFEFEKFENLLNSIGGQIIEFIKKSQDLVVDQTDKRDLVKITKVYSWAILKNNMKNTLKNSNIYLNTETVGEEDGKTKTEIISQNQLEIINQNGVKFYQKILSKLIGPILIKSKELEIYHCSNFIYHYSNANLSNEVLFRQLQLQINNKLEKMEDFRLEDVLYFTFGISKFNTNKIFPNFNNDTLSIIYPNLNEKSNDHKFSIFNKFKTRMFEKNNTLNIQNLSLICYAAALMGYADIDFYLPVYHNLILLDKEGGDNFKNKNLPKMKIEDLGYLLQSLSLLNFNDEYILNYFLEKFSKIVKKAIPYIESEIENISENNISINLNKFSTSQILSGIVNLSSRKYFKNIKNWRNIIEKIKHYFNANLTNEDKNLSISLLWFFSYFDNFDEKFYQKLFDIINQNKSSLTNYESIILNQITLYNYVKNNYIYLEFTKEFVENLNKSSIDFEKMREETQKKISMEKYQDKSFSEKMRKVAKNKIKILQKEGLGFEENYVIAKSFIAPIYFPKNNLCILFYDHSERMKDKNINGYNSMKEDILYSLGFKIERIYANECDDIIDDEDKLFDLLIKKIK